MRHWPQTSTGARTRPPLRWLRVRVEIAPGRALGSDRMEVSRLIRSLAIVLGVAVAIPMLATVAFAAIGHPECATIPEDVGPCGYWARVAYYGPFIMLWGTVVTAGFGAMVWLMVVGVLCLVSALRPRRE